MVVAGVGGGGDTTKSLTSDKGTKRPTQLATPIRYDVQSGSGGAVEEYYVIAW
jgi:tripartite-type tricarboxylate transporter receptor subunit TctC